MVLVMEYCSGGELYDYLSQQKVLQEDEARRLFRQIATAIYYCHKHKICHRDLKLENVLLDDSGNAKIADFGLSNVFEERHLLSTFCGSPLYASPEIVKGTPYIGPEVDCWSLGVLLYTLVYGAMPFDGSNFKRLVRQISHGDYFEPKNPSTASPLIREMLTVDPIQRADITHICDHQWVNQGCMESCLERAEALAVQTPVRLDLLLSLAPAPSHSQHMLVPDANAVGDEIGEGGLVNSMSSASLMDVNSSAERRILELVAEGGTDAIKPSPTRTLVSSSTATMVPPLSPTAGDHVPSTPPGLVNSGTVTMVPASPVSEPPALPAPNMSIAEQAKRKLEAAISMESAAIGGQRKKEKSATRSNSKTSQKHSPSVEKQSSFNPTASPDQPELTNSAKKTSKKELITPTEEKNSGLDSIQLNKPDTAKTSMIKSNSKQAIKDDSQTHEPVEAKKPSTVRKKSSPAKVLDDKTDVSKDSSPTKEPSISTGAVRRRSKVLEPSPPCGAAAPGPQPNQSAPVRPRVIIPGVSVGSFKEQFERRASLSSSTDVAKTSPKGAGQIKTAEKKSLSVDRDQQKDETSRPTESVKLQNIGIEPPKESQTNKVLHKSESCKEPSKNESSLSLEDARRSLQNSIALLNQAKSESTSSTSSAGTGIALSGTGSSVDQVSPAELVATIADSARQKQLRTARELISNALANDQAKGGHRGSIGELIRGSGRPPMPYGSTGRSSSATVSLSSLPSQQSLPPQSATAPSTPAIKTIYRTEAQHRVDDVRNKFPTNNNRACSVERIIPIQISSGDDISSATSASSVQAANQPRGRSIVQKNTVPFRLGSLSRSNTLESDSDAPPTPPVMVARTGEPIKKSPREFIIPIAVEGKGYVTPRQGSLEPSESAKASPSVLGSAPNFASRFTRPRRISLVSGGESEDEDDFHMHRLRSARKARDDTEKESLSSGEEDDDEGFQILTAENLFSTLLDRVRSLTQRLNGEEGPGFPQHHKSLFNNLHSPFFNRRETGPWRRSATRDMANDMDSMFHNNSNFPRVGLRVTMKQPSGVAAATPPSASAPFVTPNTARKNITKQ